MPLDLSGPSRAGYVFHDAVRSLAFGDRPTLVDIGQAFDRPWIRPHGRPLAIDIVWPAARLGRVLETGEP